MDSTMATVSIQNKMADTYGINNGLKQGDDLTRTLFNNGLEYVMQHTNAGRLNLLTNKLVQMTAYADDANAMSKTSNSK